VYSCHYIFKLVFHLIHNTETQFPHALFHNASSIYQASCQLDPKFSHKINTSVPFLHQQSWHSSVCMETRLWAGRLVSNSRQGQW